MQCNTTCRPMSCVTLPWLKAQKKTSLPAQCAPLPIYTLAMLSRKVNNISRLLFPTGVLCTFLWDQLAWLEMQKFDLHSQSDSLSLHFVDIGLFPPRNVVESGFFSFFNLEFRKVIKSNHSTSSSSSIVLLQIVTLGMYYLPTFKG